MSHALTSSPPEGCLCASCMSRVDSDALECTKCHSCVHVYCAQLPVYQLVKYAMSSAQYWCIRCCKNEAGEEEYNKEAKRIAELIEREKAIIASAKDEANAYRHNGGSEPQNASGSASSSGQTTNRTNQPVTGAIIKTENFGDDVKCEVFDGLQDALQLQSDKNKMPVKHEAPQIKKEDEEGVPDGCPVSFASENWGAEDDDGDLLPVNEFACDFCGHKSCTKQELDVHVALHTRETKYTCSVCPYQATMKSLLKNHKLTHSEEKPVSCSICSFKFKTKSSLAKHMLTHKDQKIFTCSLCPKKFSTKGVLNRHMFNIHTDEKPFSCALCPYRSKQKGGLKRHMLTHSGEKPFSCSLCFYMCTTKDDLDRHVLTHSNNGPRSCSFCSYQDSRSDRLDQHMIEKHPVEVLSQFDLQ